MTVQVVMSTAVTRAMVESVDAARKSAVMSSMQWDGAVLVGRGTVLTVRLRAAE